MLRAYDKQPQLKISLIYMIYSTTSSDFPSTKSNNEAIEYTEYIANKIPYTPDMKIPVFCGFFEFI